MSDGATRADASRTFSCEMAVLYAEIGAMAYGVFSFPITQEQLGDALGLTPVHVNRSMKALREDGLIRMTRANVTICDWVGLVSAADFDPAYLHLPPFTPSEYGLSDIRQAR